MLSLLEPGPECQEQACFFVFLPQQFIILLPLKDDGEVRIVMDKILSRITNYLDEEGLKLVMRSTLLESIT